MIESLAVLLLFQLLGEIAVQFSSAPMPGPVLGMVMLALVLSLRGEVSQRLRQNCQDLLAHLSLLLDPRAVPVQYAQAGIHRPTHRTGRTSTRTIPAS